MEAAVGVQMSRGPQKRRWSVIIRQEYDEVAGPDSLLGAGF